MANMKSFADMDAFQAMISGSWVDIYGKTRYPKSKKVNPTPTPIPATNEKREEMIQIMDTVIDDYFEDLESIASVEEKLKLLKEESSEAKARLKEHSSKIIKIMKETKCDTIFIERNEKKYVFIQGSEKSNYNESSDKLVLKEVSTPKEVKTKLAVNKLSGKKGIKNLDQLVM